MGGDHLTGERDVRDVAAIGVDTRIERQRMPFKPEVQAARLGSGLSVGG